jgi:hypothetical protein
VSNTQRDFREPEAGINSLRRIDPAAFLIGVLAAGTGLLTGKGPWGPISGFIGVVVLVMLWGFAWPKRGLSLRHRDMVSISVAFGFIFMVFCGWPTEWMMIHWFGWQPGDEADYNSTLWAMLPGAVFAIACYVWLRWQHSQRMSN